MKNTLQQIKNFCGSYSGLGLNHEQQKFQGHIVISELLGGRGLQIQFSATAVDNPSLVFHAEQSTLAPNLAGGLSLFNFNTNMPFLAEHSHVSTDATPEHQELVFRFGDTSKRETFREEIRLELMNDGSVGYHYSWGMPGADFAYRSGALMTKL